MIATGSPAEQGEKIAKCFGKKAFAAVHVDVGGAMTFGQTRFVGAKNQRQVRENGNLRAQRAVEQNLFGRVGNVIGAANHVGDAHVHVVHDDAHLVHGLAEFFILSGDRRAVNAFARTDQDEVFDFVVGKFAFAKNGVEKFGGATQRHFEAHRRFDARSGGPAIAARTTSDAANLGTICAVFRVVAADIFFRGAVAKKCGSAGQ